MSNRTDEREPPGPSHAEIAKRLGVTTSAVYQAEARAIRRLWQDKSIRKEYFDVAQLSERCIFPSSLQLRTAAGFAMPHLSGYAAKFDVLSRPLPLGPGRTFREKLAPGALDDTLAKGADVRFTLNHDPSTVMGRTRSRTLTLRSDTVGLHFDVALPNTEPARDLAAAIRRRDITDCSFAFRTLDDDWGEDSAGNVVRTLKKVDLHDGDVAAVAFPAFPQTEISARALEMVVERGLAQLRYASHPSNPANRAGTRLEYLRRRIDLALLE